MTFQSTAKCSAIELRGNDKAIFPLHFFLSYEGFFHYTLKKSENPRLSDIFRGYIRSSYQIMRQNKIELKNIGPSLSSSSNLVSRVYGHICTYIYCVFD